MSDFFDKLGAAARHTAGTVNTQVSIAAEEQKLRETYQALGKLYYQKVKAGISPEGSDFDPLMEKADASRKRIRELKDLKSPSASPNDGDFEDLD